jgi:hypothetical protein
LLRETPLPFPAWLPFPLPVRAWDTIAHVHWTFQILRGIDISANDVARADRAIAWLTSFTNANSVVAVTHGVFRRTLAQRLHAGGWRALTGRRSYACWSVWSFVRAAPY